MRIKICGLKDVANMRKVAALRPDMMGMVFHEGSPRCAGGEALKEYCRRLEHVTKVGVFVDAGSEQIRRYVEDYFLDAVQLHGSETPEQCAELRDAAYVIKAFGISESFDFATVEPYIAHTDLFVFDTKTPLHGGSGETFSWPLLDRYTHDHPFLLSGGLGVEQIDALQHFRHPSCIGFDASSRLEDRPGVKNISLVKTFIHALQHR